MRRYIIGKESMSGAYLESARIMTNSDINSANLLKLRRYLLNKDSIDQK